MKQNYPVFKSFSHVLVLIGLFFVILTANGQDRELLDKGKSYLDTKKYAQAKQFFQQAVDHAQKNSAFEELAEAYDGLAKVAEAQKDFKSAITYVRFMQGAYDSIMIRDHRKKMTEIESKYSKLLEEKDSALVVEESQHRQQKTQGLLRLIEREDIRLTFYAVALALSFIILCFAGLWFATRKTARLTEIKLRNEQAGIRTANEEFEIISRQIHGELIGSLNEISFSKTEDIRLIGETMIGNMMNLVWLINPNNRSLESLVEYIRDQTNTLLKPSGVNYMIVFPDRVPNVQVTSLERVNLYFVTLELIRYALETSKATGITLSLSIENKQMIFKVKDNTTPIDESKAKRRADEILPLRERMEQINGTIGLVVEQGAMVVIYRKDLP